MNEDHEVVYNPMFSEIIFLLTAYDFNSINYNNIAEKRELFSSPVLSISPFRWSGKWSSLTRSFLVRTRAKQEEGSSHGQLT